MTPGSSYYALILVGTYQVLRCGSTEYGVGFLLMGQKLI